MNYGTKFISDDFLHRLHQKDADVENHPLLDSLEEADLIARAQKGDTEATKRLTQCNIRLLWKIAHRYKGRGVSFLDLVQEGSMGFLKAVEKFQFGKGTRLATYAGFWIKQKIKRAIADQAGPMRLPQHVGQIVSRIKRTCSDLEQELGRKPTEEEIAEELDVSLTRVQKYLPLIGWNYVSLNGTVGDGEEGLYTELIADPNAEEPSAGISRSSFAKGMKKALGRLSERERAVLEYRFGFRNGGESLTLEATGKIFPVPVTRERVRQIETKALSKLREAWCLKLIDETQSSRFKSKISDRQRRLVTSECSIAARVRINSENPQLGELCGKAYMERIRFLSATEDDNVLLHSFGNTILELLEYVYGVPKEHIRAPRAREAADEDAHRIAVYFLTQVGLKRASVSTFLSMTRPCIRDVLWIVDRWMQKPAFAETIKKLVRPVKGNSRPPRKWGT